MINQGSCIYLLFSIFTLLNHQTAVAAPSQPKEDAPSVSPEVSQPKLNDTLLPEAIKLGNQSQKDSDLPVSSSKPDDASLEPETSLPNEKDTKVIAPTYSASDDLKEPIVVSQPDVLPQEEAVPQAQPQPDIVPQAETNPETLIPQDKPNPEPQPEDKVKVDASSSAPSASEVTSDSSTTLRQREVDVMDATTAISVKYIHGGIPAQPIPLPDHLSMAQAKPSGRHGTFRFASFEPFFQMSEAGQLGILYDSEGALARHERDSSRY